MLDKIVDGINIILNFFYDAFVGYYLFLWQIVSYVLEQFYELLVYMMVGFVNLFLGFAKFTITLSFDMAVEFISTLRITSDIALYYSNLPESVRQIIEFTQLHTAINLIISAYVARFMMSFIPFSPWK